MAKKSYKVKKIKPVHSFSFPCSKVMIWATEQEERNVIHTHKALADDLL